MLKRWAYLNHVLLYHLSGSECLSSVLLSVFRGLLFSNLSLVQQLVAHCFVCHCSRWLYFEMLYVVIWKTSLVQPKGLQKGFCKLWVHLIELHTFCEQLAKEQPWVGSISRYLRSVLFLTLPTGHGIDSSVTVRVDFLSGKKTPRDLAC